MTCSSGYGAGSASATQLIEGLGPELMAVRLP